MNLPPPPPPPMSPGTPSSTPHILTTKVQRALEVQTTTPSMISALSALDNLPQTSSSSNTNTTIDARSVRAAIEQDALQQALLFEDELRKLVGVVTELRESVTDIATAAAAVKKAIDTDVVCVTSDLAEGEEKREVEGEGRLEEEKQLARVLAEAFRARDEAQRRAATVKTFLEKFDLSDNDNYLLDHYSFEEFGAAGEESMTTNGTNFLNALKRVSTIRIELAKTFGDSGGVVGGTLGGLDDLNKLGATSAIRLMENLAAKQDRAYERLYHWLQQYLSLNIAAVAHVPTSSAAMRQGVNSRLDKIAAIDEDEMDERLSHPFVKRCLSVLRRVPHYHTHTLELVATQRRSEVTRRFLLALTQGYNGMHPIEMKAHDPVNYIGDMLAFLFRSLSIECEIARGLVDGDNDFDEGNTDLLGEDDELITGDIGTKSVVSSVEMLSQAMSGVTRPLKSRVSQVVTAMARRPDEKGVDDEDDQIGDDDLDESSSLRARIAALYAICGLLLYYHSALEKATLKLTGLEKKNSEGVEVSDYEKDQAERQSHIALVETIQECENEACLAYTASVRVYVATLESTAGIMDETEATVAASLITRISEERAASPGFADKQTKSDSGGNGSVSPNLSLAFICDTVLPPALEYVNNSLDDILALKGALEHCKKSGLEPNVEKKWRKVLDTRMSKIVEELIEKETKRTLQLCGLGAIYESLIQAEKHVTENLPLSSQPGLSPAQVQDAMKVFYSSLFNPPLPHFDTIKDADLKLDSRKKTAKNVARVYEQIYEKVVSRDGGYDNLQLGHTPEQVRTLLSI